MSYCLFSSQALSTTEYYTLSLHDALPISGHGLSQDHFGKAFLSGNGKLHFAPLAVMNASYSGVQTTIGKTDLGGHCRDRKSTRLNSSHLVISYAVFCLKKKKKRQIT